MNRTIVMLLCLTSWLTLPAFGQDPAPNDSRLETVRSNYAEQIARFDSAVKLHLDKNEAAARRQGNLDEVKAAQHAHAEYTEAGKLPDELPAAVQRILISAKKRLRVEYEKEIRSLVRAGADSVAELYKTELDRLLKEPRMLTLKDRQVVGITAKKPVGYEVGEIAEGERLVLQYRGGRWKAWGRTPSASPDEVPEPFDRIGQCRVAIGSIQEDGTFERLAVVPPNTASAPFHWTATRSHNKVILRINDPDSRFDDNPDAGVKYLIAIYRY